METKEGRCTTILLEERNVWSEEECIVVVANESLFGEECLSHNVDTVRHGLLGAHVRPNTVGFTHSGWWCGC